MSLSIDSTELIYLLLGPGALLLIAIMLRVDLRLKARCDELADRLTEAEGRLSVLQQLESDDSLERELEGRIALLAQQHEQLLMRDSETGPYFRAVRLAENGASLDSLIEQTGVTQAEAELILSLHGRFGADQTEAVDELADGRG
jgi:Protein of unknown function (DUF2802)